MLDRIAEHSRMKARFAKWRAVIKIGEGMPSQTCIDIVERELALV